MNKTHFIHTAIALAIMCVFGLLGQWFAGAACAIGVFISREHAHRQVDIYRTTGVPVPKQNPLKGFTGWSKDAMGDAGLPAIACIALLYYVTR